MKRILILCYLSVLAIGVAKAQTCGLEQDVYPIAFNGQTIIPFEMTNVLNDDLADPGQGVCAVELSMILGPPVTEFQVWLESPDGTRVELIGPYVQSFLPGNPTRLNIRFVPDAADTDPDPGYPSQWNNTIPGGYFPLLNPGYTGTYHPAFGSLEDFNTGPANGTWRLIIENATFFEISPNELYDLRIILCDEAGRDCCFADAGALTQDNVTACEGADELRLDLPPAYPLSEIQPDTSTYGYTYAISRAGILVGYDSIPDLTDLPAGDYQVCGLSFQRAEQDNLPAPDGTLTVDELRDNLSGATPFFCGDLSEECISVSILPNSAPVALRDSICPGDTLFVGMDTLTTAGDHTILLPNAAGCDSIINVELTVLPSPVIDSTQTICANDSIVIGNSVYRTTGAYSDTLQTIHGCDSIINLDLTVRPLLATALSDTICRGASYTVGDSIFTENGRYEVVLTASTGCDSTVTLDLRVLDIASQILPPDTLTCRTSTITLSAQTTGADTPAYTWLDSGANIIGTGNAIDLTQPGDYILEANLHQCTIRDTVRVPANQTSPVSDAGATDTLNCSDKTQLALGGPATSLGNNFTYVWSTDTGHFLTATDQPQVTVDSGGVYQLIVTDATNGCRDTSQVVIVENNTPPVAEAGLNQLITCTEPVATLDAGASDQTPGLMYTWTTLSGAPLDTSDPLRPQATTAGIYELTVLNPDNGCAASDRVAVFSDTLSPEVNIFPPETITCDQPEIRLLSQLIAAGNDPVIAWTGPSAGSIRADADAPSPLVAEAGTYEVLVINPDNGCSDSTSVRVEADVTPPPAAIAPPDTMRCAGQVITLTYDGTDTTGLDLQWNAPDGTPLGMAATQAVDQPGAYTLTVTNRANGCFETDVAEIVADTIPPAVTFGDLLKPCEADTFLLSASLDRDTALFDIAWSGPALLSDSTRLSPTVTGPGDYLLTLTRRDADCAFTYVASVTEPPCSPCLETDPAPTFTCNENELQLEVRFCEECTDCSIEWTTADGLIRSGANTLTPVVSQAGTYTISVTDTFGITAQLDINVSEERVYPVAVAGPDTALTCRVSSILLGSDSTDAGDDFQLRWRSADTGSTSLSDTPFLEVDRDGDYILEVRNVINGCIQRDTVSVGLDTIPPLADAGPDTLLTCDRTSLRLDGSNADAGPGILYQWTAADGGAIDADANTAAPLISTPGTYTLQVFDDRNGCSASDQVVVSRDILPPDFSIATISEPTCADTTVLLQPEPLDTARFAYEWCQADGAGNILDCQAEPTLEALIGNNYRLRVTNRRTGCENTAFITVVVELDPPPVAAGADTVFTCYDQQLTLSGTAPDDATLTWNTADGLILSGEDTATPLIGAPGAYVLTATDPVTLCSASDTVLVSDDLVRPEARLAPDPDQLILTCAADTLTVDASASLPSGDQGLRYQWRTEETTDGLAGATDQATVQITAGGQYQLIAQDIRNGCTDTLNFTIGIDFTEPAIDLAPAEAITCNRSSVTLDGSGSETGPGIRHRWFRDDQLLPDTSLTLTVRQPGSYRLESAYLDNGCTNEATVVVAGDTLPPQIQIAPPVILDCDNPVVTLDASATTGGQLTFNWYTNEGNIVSGRNASAAEVDAPGRYYLQVTDLQSGCVGLDSIDVSLTGVRLSGVNLSLRPPTCPGRADGAVHILSVTGGTDPFVFALNDDNFTTDTSFTGLLAGDYRLRVQDAAGCEIDTVFTLQAPEGVTVNLGEDRKIRRGEEVRLEALTNVKSPASILWSPAGLFDRQDTLIQLLEPRQSAVYRVEITDENGCVGGDEVQVIVSNDLPVYIANGFSPNEDGENDRFFIQAGSAVPLIRSFRIFDRWGNTVFETANIPPNDPLLGWDGRFAGQPMDAAVFVYFAEVELADGQVEMVTGEVVLVR